MVKKKDPMDFLDDIASDIEEQEAQVAGSRKKKAPKAPVAATRLILKGTPAKDVTTRRQIGIPEKFLKRLGAEVSGTLFSAIPFLALVGLEHLKESQKILEVDISEWSGSESVEDLCIK